MQLIAEGSEDDDDTENHHNNTHPLGGSAGGEKPDDVLRRDAVEDFLVLLDTSEKKLLPEVPRPVPYSSFPAMTLYHEYCYYSFYFEISHCFSCY